MTQKPLSTISYNTLDFLTSKLNELYSAHIIQAFMFICHKGEDGDKDHIHLRIEPNKRLDPMDLSDLFKEYLPGHDKPLGVRPWRQSKEEDWFLYSVHDSDYMKIKYPNDIHEKLPYQVSDIVVSPDYDLQIAWIRAKQSLLHTSASLIKQLRSGADPVTLVESGENVFSVSSVSNLLEKQKKSRVDDLEQELIVAYHQIDFLRDILDIYGLSIDYIYKGALTIPKIYDIIKEDNKDG